MTADEDERRRAFETLYRVTLPSIRSYARRRAPDDLADDVVAQTYLTAWRRCDEAVAGGLPWLYRTARFTLANHQRTERRQLRVAQRVISTTELVEADGTAEADERSLMLDALDRLSDDEREILLLVYWEHLSVKAVAVVLDCRPGTAAVRLHRARRKLRDAFWARTLPNVGHSHEQHCRGALMKTLTRRLAELDPEAGKSTEITAQDHDLLRAIMAQPLPAAVRKQRNHVRRSLVIGGLVAASVGLGVVTIDTGGHDVGASPAAAAVLERAADVTIKTSDPVVGPGQYLRVTTIDRSWGRPASADHVQIGRDGKPIVFQNLRTQRMWVPHDRAGTWVFDEESHTLRNLSVDGKKYTAGEDHHIWTSKGGESTNWHEYSKYQDADWYATLPRDPERLLATLLKDAHDYAAVERYAALEEAVTPVLTSGLAPADVRAAVFRALADEPQVRIVGGITHVNGKAAIALRMGYAQELLFDRETGQFIGNQTRDPGFPEIPGVDADEPTSVTTVRIDVVDSAPYAASS